MSERDREVLEALAAARKKHEDLADLLDFYYDLYEVQFAAKVHLPDPGVRDDMAVRWRLEGGIPQLTFDQLAVELEAFAELVARIRQVLLQHNPSWELEDEGHAPEQLVSLARHVFEAWDTLTSPRVEDGPGSEDSAQPVRPSALTVGFALAPYLQKASETILPRLDLERWVQGYCPVCGGRPNFSLLEAKRGARRLICSRCNSLWQYSRVGCPFCRSKEKQTYFASEDGVYRLYVCPDCKRYLKTIDLRDLERPVQPVVERLLTVGMDLAAQAEGLRT
ncbi:MAG: formate dehydrogenase accessory protein FdhE [Anaerolineae bacterium]|nr:formate dehydrogenase accessory protein FdhE [Anaerolineae bacterium]